VETVVKPCLAPEDGRRRLAWVTRWRAEARVSHPVVAHPQATGRPPKWGPRLAAPHHHLYWPVGWQAGRAWIYGRLRRFQDKQRRWRWAVSGPAIPRPVFVAAVEGDTVPWFLVTSALEWSAAQVIEGWAARCRQEDGFRDHQQRLGMEECRAWTKEPLLRTFQVPLVALTLVRRLQARLTQAWRADTWWDKPAGNQRKRHASILDLRRLFWRYRTECSHFLVHLEELEPFAQPLPLSQDLPERAA
jgi:hypothetical protein